MLFFISRTNWPFGGSKSQGSCTGEEEKQHCMSEYSDFNSFINNYIKQLIKSHALSVEIHLKYRGNLCTTV